jgi:hypothetical protein
MLEDKLWIRIFNFIKVIVGVGFYLFFILNIGESLPLGLKIIAYFKMIMLILSTIQCLLEKNPAGTYSIIDFIRSGISKICQNKAPENQ